MTRRLLVIDEKRIEIDAGDSVCGPCDYRDKRHERWCNLFDEHLDMTASYYENEFTIERALQERDEDWMQRVPQCLEAEQRALDLGRGDS